ncbi:MAG: class D beta-lactamase [Ilyomonas sp.]
MKNKKTICSFFLLFTLYFLLSCNQNNITTDNSLKKYFDENNVTGSFAIFDNSQAHFTIYNLNRYRDSAYTPASTFKILNSLIGLQTGKITSEKMVIKWDGIKREISNWNQDLTMTQAFKYSAVPYYQEVARRIGRDTMQHWLDTIHYGNAKIGDRIDSFWLDNSLKLTADEQLGFIKKLYFEQLPFEKRPQNIVKEVMLQESNSNYKLSYKTGWGFRENGNAIGWVVGWIEENRHPYLFVLNVEGPHDINMSDVRMKIFRDILKQLGFFEGRK